MRRSCLNSYSDFCRLQPETSPDRFAALSALWSALIHIADFFKDESLFWRRLRIPVPGECFLLSRQLFLDGITFEIPTAQNVLLSQFHTPTVTYDPKCDDSDFRHSSCSPMLNECIVPRTISAYVLGDENHGLCSQKTRMRR